MIIAADLPDIRTDISPFGDRSWHRLLKLPPAMRH
jgi:hypothetical protein